MYIISNYIYSRVIKIEFIITYYGQHKYIHTQSKLK